MNLKLTAFVLGVALATAFVAYQLGRHGADTLAAQQQQAADAASAALFATSFNDLEGKPQAMVQWQGKVMVVNFWATWCPPCRKEMPEFIKLQEKYREKGLIFVGIAIDQKDKVQPFVDEIGVNYPALLGEVAAIDLSRKMGNRVGGLPFTVIVDRNGRVAATEAGELNGLKLESLIKPLL